MSGQRPLLAGATITLVLGAVLAGCGGDSISAGDATVLVGERANGGEDAMGGGTLELVGGCLGASGFVIVWPHGTEVTEEDPLTIDLPGEGEVSVGDKVEVAGGFALEHTSTDVKPGAYDVAGVTVPAECAKHDIFVARRGD